jgi:DNA primase
VTLSPAFLDELRARTTLSTLISRSIKLQRAGGEFKACCPFHDEKTASFTVNDDKGFAHCFGCAWHGDAIKWLVEHRGLEFLDAVRELADAAGLDMPARDEREDRAAGLHPVVARADAWFREQLMGLSGGEARAYLAGRGIDDAAIDAFGIGLAPDGRNRLRSALSDLDEEVLIAAGLVIDPEDGDPYDRFRGRIMFPIRDQRGRTIAFGGRILGPGEPKYLNSPAGPLFDKGRSLFNIDRAGPAARKAGRLIVVEGYMDVIGLAHVGLDEAVAVNGTALTESQLGLMWRLNPSPFLCFDGDAAGHKAAVRAALRALPGLEPGRTLRFVTIPGGKDPDDLARAGGAVAVEKMLVGAVSLADILWVHERGGHDLSTPEAKAGLRQRLVAHARTIGHRDLAGEYEQDFRTRLDELFGRKGKAGRRARDRKRAPAPRDDGDGVQRKLVTAVLRGLARHPAILADQLETVMDLPITTGPQQAAMQMLLDGAFAQAVPAPEVIDELFPDDRGWRGFRCSYVATPGTDRAKGDLIRTIEALTGIAPATAEDSPVA